MRLSRGENAHGVAISLLRAGPVTVTVIRFSTRVISMRIFPRGGFLNFTRSGFGSMP
jgi:hypothetical protein